MRPSWQLLRRPVAGDAAWPRVGRRARGCAWTSPARPAGVEPVRGRPIHGEKARESPLSTLLGSRSPRELISPARAGIFSAGVSKRGGNRVFHEKSMSWVGVDGGGRPFLVEA